MKLDKTGIKERIGFFAAVGAVGGIVIGTAVGTDLSPVAAGVLGGIFISLTMVLLNLVWDGWKFGE